MKRADSQCLCYWTPRKMSPEKMFASSRQRRNLNEISKITGVSYYFFYNALGLKDEKLLNVIELRYRN